MSNSLHWEKFWLSHPALFYGLFFLLGTFFGLIFSILSFLFVLCFFLISIKCSMHFKKRFGVAFIIFFIGSITSYYSCTYPPIDKTEFEGRAFVRLEKVQPLVRYGKVLQKLKLKVYSFTTDAGETIAKNISCMSLCKDSDFKNDEEYLVEGKLLQFQPRLFSLKIERIISTKNSPSLFSLSALQVSMQTQARLFFASQFPPSLARDFLQGLLFGEIQNDFLFSTVKKMGLQHVLVVSGFHFGCLLLIIGMIVKPILHGRKSVIFFLILMGIYFIFIGTNPSVFRAFIMASCVLLGELFRQNASSLNALGVALVVLLGFDPTYAVHLGFQLSFLATFGILLLYYPCKEMLFRVFPKRSLKEFLELNICSQVGASILGFVRSGLCLSFVVNIMIIPIVLKMPNGFAWHSLMYNIFIPVLIGLGLQLSLLGFVCFYIPYLKNILLSCSIKILDFALSFLLHPPKFFLGYCPEIEVMHVCEVAYLFFVLYFGVVVSQKYSDNIQEESPSLLF